MPVRPFQLLPETEPANIGSALRKRLGILEAEIDALAFDEAYGFWKEKVENDGVLVYESQYLPDESGVIGAAIYYEDCPIILIKRGGTLMNVDYSHYFMSMPICLKVNQQ